jgi:hypothetical protein
MNQSRLVQERKTCEQLLGKYSHQCGAQASELVLLDQLVEIDAQQFKDKTQMLSVYKSILQSQEVMVIILIHLLIQLLQLAEQSS